MFRELQFFLYADKNGDKYFPYDRLFGLFGIYFI